MDFEMLNNLVPENNPEPKKQIDKKKLKRIIIIALTIVVLITMIILYITNVKVRDFFDKYIFRKEVYENNLTKIELTEDDNNHVYAFSKNIVVLNKNTLDIYNSSGKKENSLNIEIANPLFVSEDKFLVIAESNGQKLYVISDNNILWQESVTGDIINITVNKNGYVSVVVNNTGYRTEVMTYDSNGKFLFKKALAVNYAIDVSISEDNKYLAIAEANFSGTLIQSSVEIISIEKAIGNENDSYNYKAEANKLIVNIEYQEKNRLLCMYDDSVHIIENNNDKELIKYDYKNTLFIDINLNSTIAHIEKISTDSLTSNSEIKFTNIINNSTNSYEIGGIPKSVCSYKGITAINLGSEVVFVRTSGWLSKRYRSSQEIQNIILANGIAGIVYKNKIEIVKL